MQKTNLFFTFYFLIVLKVFFVPIETYGFRLSCQNIFAEESFNNLTILNKITLLKDAQESPDTFLETYGKKRRFDFKNKALDNINVSKMMNIIGSSNLGIYRVPSEASILKIHKTTDIRNFISRVLGNYLGTTFKNVMEIVEFGTVITPDGIEYFYTLLKEVHPNEQRFSLKDAWAGKQAKEFLIEIFQKYPNAVQDLASSCMDFIRLKIVPDDPDFMVSNNGKLIWIDTDYWEIGTHSNISMLATSLHDLNVILNIISYKISTDFKSHFRRQLESADDIDPEVKNKIQQKLLL